MVQVFSPKGEHTQSIKLTFVFIGLTIKCAKKNIDE